MCLAIPGKLIGMNTEADALFRTGIVDFDGMEREVNLMMVPEAREGDYVVVHVGIALSRINAREAQKALAAIREMENIPNDATTGCL